MAQKKITDLQLIAEVLTGLNVPGDDGLQTYRFTVDQLKSFILANGNIGLAMLNASIFNGLTAVTPADDDYFIFNDTSDSNKTKKGLVGSFVRTLYRTVALYPATVASTDASLRLTGSSGTITLPANNASAPGRKIKMLHDSTSFTSIFTVATTGGATLGPAAVASGDYKLYTRGEWVEWEDDGTNWQISGRYARTSAVIYTPTVQGLGTLASSTLTWSRDGEWLVLNGNITGGTATAVQMQVQFPSNCQNARTSLGTLTIVGQAAIPFSSSSGFVNHPGIYASAGQNYLNFQTPSNSSILAGTGSGVSGTGVIVRINARILIEGWQP